MANTAKRANECPACSGRGVQIEAPGFVYRCKSCEGIFGNALTLGDSYNLVLPRWSAEPNVPVERTRYFDLTGVGSSGPFRRHGWFDTETRAIVQVG